MSAFSAEEVSLIHSRLVKWYDSHRRMLPWRGDPVDDEEKLGKTPERSAYGVWVSEVMLQQTQVATVIPYWMKWMKAFPDVRTLAAATSDEANALWAGLGYYRRCQFLLKGAQMVVKDLDGQLPSDPDALLKIPGVGPYTAGAISSIYFGKSVPIVDGNVMRVFARMRALETPVGPALEKQCWTLAKSVVSTSDKPASFNQGLMELGATVCTPKNPSCDSCPVADHCMARRSAEASLSEGRGVAPDIEDIVAAVVVYPHKTAKKRAREVFLSVGVFSYSRMTKASSSRSSSSNSNSSENIDEGSVEEQEEVFLFVRRPKTGLLANQWELPSVTMWEEATKDVKNTNSTESNGDCAVPPPEFTRDELWAALERYLREIMGLGVSTSSSTLETRGNADHDEKKDVVKVPPDSTSTTTCRRMMILESELRPRGTVQHIFSHQRHTMHVLSHRVQYQHVDQESESRSEAQWVTSCAGALEIRWMTSAECDEAGVTTGVKKVLSFAKTTPTPTSTSKTANLKTTKKRKQSSGPEKGQPKLSSFFSQAKPTPKAE